MSARREQVVKLRRDGLTFAEIGAEVGISRQGARWNFKRAEEETRQSSFVRRVRPLPEPRPRPGGPGMLTYDFPLRRDLVVRLTLPVDLTEDDAVWLGGYVRALAH